MSFTDSDRIKGLATGQAPLGRVISEKGQLLHDGLSAINAVLSSMPVASVNQGDALSLTSVGTPMPLSLLSPSGLSRPQLQTLAQAVGLPAFPSYAAAQGGLVSLTPCPKTRFSVSGLGPSREHPVAISVCDSSQAREHVQLHDAWSNRSNKISFGGPSFS